MNNNLIVVQSNQLIDASYSLSVNEKRLVMLAATKFNSKISAPLSPVRIYVSEFVNHFNIDKNSAYRELKSAVDSILTKPVRIYNQDEDKVIKLAWLIASEYKKSDGSHVDVIFSPLITPFLFELKNNFTSVDFEYASKLNTTFSVRLYEWLKSVQHLHSYKINHAVVKEFDIEWMKDRAQINGYPRWGDFNDYVIKPAVDKINANTDISVFYEPVKTGRKVTAVKFNYVVEKDASCMKPMRPRLYRRPKVMKGTHEEGVWMRKNLALLLEYETQLKRYDDKEKLALTDLRKIAEYASICDRITEDRAKKEIELRTIK
jgi:plasmid replication initiation protein